MALSQWGCTYGSYPGWTTMTYFSILFNKTTKTHIKRLNQGSLWAFVSCCYAVFWTYWGNCFHNMPDFDQIWPSYYFLLNHRLSSQDYLKLYWTRACLVIKKEKSCWVPGGKKGKLKNYGWSSLYHFSLVQWFMWLLVLSVLPPFSSHTQHIQCLTSCIFLRPFRLGWVAWGASVC